MTASMNRRLARVAHACARCMALLLPVLCAVLIFLDVLLICGVQP